MTNPPPTTPQISEIFLLPLTRAELELIEGEISVMYAIELAKATAPYSMVLTGDGATPYPEWLARLGAREVGRKLAKFIDAHGVDGIRVLTNKLFKLEGRPDLP